MKGRMVKYNSYDSPRRPKVKSVEWEKSLELQGEGHSLDLENALRSLRIEIRIYKHDN